MSRRRAAVLLAAAALAPSALLLATGCGSPPVQTQANPLDVAPTTAADLALAASTEPRPAAVAADPRSSTRVLAHVNGEVVSYRDVFLRVGPQLAVVEDPAVRAKLERKELMSILRDRLLHQAAVESGIDVDRDEIEKERGKHVRDLARNGATLDAYLAERGMTRREYDETLRRNLRAERYLRAAVGLGGQAAVLVRARTDTWVTPAEMKKFHDRHPERFHEPTKARVRVLSVMTDLGNEDRSAATTAARERAEACRSRLLAGEDFVPLFREMNPGPSNPPDGLVEISERGRMSAEIEDFAFTASRGAVSEVLQPRSGTLFLVLRAEGVTPERRMSFEEAQQGIEMYLMQQRRAMAAYEVELSLLEEAVLQPADLAAALREELSLSRRRIAADVGL